MGPDEGLGDTRRRFLARSGMATAAAASALSVGGAGAAASTASRLGAHRRDTYKALVEAVALSPGTLVDPRGSARATSALARFYRGAEPRTRASVDAALDELDSGLRRPFSALAPGRRLAHLRAALDAPGDGRRSRVRDAVALAAAPFDPLGFRWNSDRVDLWVRIARSRAAAERARAA